VNYGFVIDNRKCIGCHACSTACKSENEVPLGVYRTWVKYTEVGRYPDVTRRFQVTRCNHCDNAPCVRICPVTAMYQRDDGIVDFDGDQCIGCKACMQACPYDSIHINPETNTAAKCNFCAHRVESNLEPSCVVVCPTHAIIAGDLEDPKSEISKILGKEKVAVRKPEQGTAPKLFYIDGDSISLNPTAVNATPETYMWADVVGESKFSGPDTHQHTKLKKTFLGDSARVSQGQGVPAAGNVPSTPVQAGEQMAQSVYNAQHKVPWHWPVPAYLVTKGLGAGPLLILTVLFSFGLASYDQMTTIWAASAGLFFVLVTTALLIYDLDRPERFLRMVFRPQWKSWLPRGAFILIGFSNLLGAQWAMLIGEYFGVVPANIVEMVNPAINWIMIPLALMTIIYTAFLFAQAEGRDLWQSTSLPWHLLVQGLMCGSALLMVLGEMYLVTVEIANYSRMIFISTLILDLFFQAFEFGMPHASEIAGRAAHEITGGVYKNKFWFGNIVVGHFVALALVLLAGSGFGYITAAIAAMVGLYFYEYAFVMAPQRIPNS
jgi:Fe-S-cluster-containing dehydrogenase component/formate-dependent nitrite reductase membrane component NrfD